MATLTAGSKRAPMLVVRGVTTHATTRNLEAFGVLRRVTRGAG